MIFSKLFLKQKPRHPCFLYLVLHFANHYLFEALRKPHRMKRLISGLAVLATLKLLPIRLCMKGS